MLTFPPSCEFGKPTRWAPILRRHLTKHNGMWLVHNIIHKKTRLSTMNKRAIHCKVTLAFNNTCKPSHERGWKLEWCNIITKIEHAIWFLKIFWKSFQVWLNQFSTWFNNQNWIYCIIEDNHSCYNHKNHCPSLLLL